MAVTNSTTFSSAIETIWRTEIVPSAEGMMPLSNLAVSEGVPVNGGNTMRTNRVLRAAKQTSATGAGTQVKLGDSGIKALSSNFRDFNLEVWSDSFGFTDEIDIVSFITQPKNQKIIANQMARTHEYQLTRRLAREGLNWAIDTNSGADQKFGNAIAGSTTTVINTSLTDANGYWDKAQICFYNPASAAYDDGAYVTSYLLASGACTLGRAINIPTATTSKFIISRRTALSSTDIMTVSGLEDVAFVHEHMETPRFPGGLLRGVFSAAQHRDLRKDTRWSNFVQYDRANLIENYTPGRWCDMEFLITSEPYKTDVDGTENQATGAVHSAPIFGADSFACFRYGNGVGNFNSEFFIADKAEKYDLINSHKFLSWKTKWTGGVLRGTSVVVLNTGVTAYGFDAIA